ncbi:MAG: ATP synthase subunit I [Acidimicrobiia bacterium]|nr:ATP synthase subunit I [Acidimicrobiia bacterium]
MPRPRTILPRLPEKTDSGVPEFPCGPRGIETRMVRQMLPILLVITPLALLLAGLLRGADGLVSAAIGLVLAFANLWASAFMMERAARISPQMLMAAAMMGFIGRLVILTGIVLLLSLVPFVDVPTLVVVLAATHIVLVVGETLVVGADDRARDRERVLRHAPERNVA